MCKGHSISNLVGQKTQKEEEGKNRSEEGKEKLKDLFSHSRRSQESAPISFISPLDKAHLKGENREQDSRG